MKRLCCLTLGSLLLCLIASPLFSADARLGGITLLPGYKHEIYQGIDSLIGAIKKEDGLRIGYEIGIVTKPGAPRTGGSFIDRPMRVYKENVKDVRWYREHVVAGQPVHLAYLHSNLLLVSYPKAGLNMSVVVRNAGDMAEALLMILTYPDPIVENKVLKEKKATKKTKTLEKK